MIAWKYTTSGICWIALETLQLVHVQLGSHRNDKYHASPQPIKLQLLFDFTPDAVAHGHLHVMRMSMVNMAAVLQKCYQMQ